MRVLRVVAVVVAGLLGLLIVALIAVLLFVDPNKYRGQIEQAARQHTDRELTIGGKLQLRFFPWLALSVGDARLSNRPGFGTEPFLTVRNASIGVAVLPLLGGRLEVSRIRLEGVSLNLVSRGAQNNWQDLSESDESEQTQTAAKPVGPAPSKGAEGAEASRKPGTRGHLSVEGMDLSRFSVVYRDEVKKTTTEISNAELHMAALDVGSQRVAMGKLELEGTYLARGVASPASAEAGHSPEEPKPLSFALRTSALTLDGVTEILSPAKAELKVGDSALTISVSGEKMSSDPQVSGTVTIPNTSARKLLQSLGIAPPVTRDPQALAIVGLQTNFRL
ncbi:MAG TPA: AsmA family protein, partial [Steroidobacteraceae bacterium]|nr:AsmA family protein [Steroidobacteraceae bacterium]